MTLTSPALFPDQPVPLAVNSPVIQRRRLQSLALAVLLTALLTPADLMAETSIESVQIGLDQMAKPGIWTRARVRLTSTSSVECRIEVESPDPDGNAVTYPGSQVRLESGSPNVVDVFFKPGRLETTVTVRAVRVDSDEVLATLKHSSVSSGSSAEASFRVVRNSVPAWIVVGQLPGSPGLAANPDRDAISKLRGSGIHITELASPADLPVQWSTMSAWRAVVMSGQFEIPQPQSDALQTWVQDGGHLVLAVGTHSDELLASPLADWALVGQKVIPGSISDLSGLELLVSSFADQQGGSIPLEDRRVPFFNPRRGVTFEQTDGLVLAAGLDGAVLTRHACGFGRISLSGVDLNEAPLARWRGLDSFLTSVVDVPVGTTSEGPGSARISHAGITELATQLQNGMEHFESVGERSTLSILGLTLLYLLLIGPVDWFLVHRVLKRPGLTWCTFPLSVLLCGFLAGASARGSNGADVRVNTLEIVDIDVQTGYGRQTVWSSIYSPSNRRARISMSAGQHLGTTRPVWISWSGIPESYFGGMYRTSGIEFGRPAWRLASGPVGYEGIDGLPIPIWSDRVLLTNSEFQPPPELFTSQLQRSGSKRLTPDSSFTHNLPVAIQDWLLVDMSHIYYHRLADGELLQDTSLPPGEKWTPTNQSVGVQALRAFLTGSRFQESLTSTSTGGTDYMTTQVDWDSSNTDLATIVRMLTLHEKSGGTEYTGLTNTILPQLELSDCLQLDRVILLGRIELPCSDLRIDGEAVEADRRATFIRVLLPVKGAVMGDLPEFD